MPSTVRSEEGHKFSQTARLVKRMVLLDLLTALGRKEIS